MQDAVGLFDLPLRAGGINYNHHMDTSLPIPKLEERLLGQPGIPLLTDEALAAATGVRVAFAGRLGGVSEGCFAQLNCGLHVGDDAHAVTRNRTLLFDALGVTAVPSSTGTAAVRAAFDKHRGSSKPPVAYVVPTQVHGTDIVRIARLADVSAAQEASLEGADGLVVETAGVAALLNFADCLPVVVVSPTGRFAVAHAGWRGAVKHIAARAVRELARGDAASPASYNAYVGPHIHVECFEVGEDVAHAFADAFGGRDEGEGDIGAVVAEDGYHVSLATAVSLDLMAAGLARERIVDAGVCTKCNPDRFFSYRASGGRCGRQASVAFRMGES